MKFIKPLPWVYLLVCTVILAAFCSSAKAVEVKGILLPQKIPAGYGRLHLNGTAVRSKWGFNAYVVALYLTKESRNAKAIMLNRDPKRIHITMLHNISEQRFVSTIKKNIDVNFSTEEKQQFASGLTSFMDCFHGGTSLKKFTVINIDYLPGKGMKVSVDGSAFKTIPNDDFYHAILRLWIGQPPQLSLKTGLVGIVD